MKYILSLLIFTIISANKSMAQSEEMEVKTLLGSHTKVRGFGSFDMKLSKWNNNTALLLGAHGGIILNNKIILGLGGYGVSTYNEYKSAKNEDTISLGGGYGGLVLGYSIFPTEVVHLHFPILFGGGGAEVYNRNDRRTQFEFNNIIESGGFLVIEPGVEVELNITKFFKLAVGGSYRFIEGENLDHIKPGSLTSWSSHISLKFGKF